MILMANEKLMAKTKDRNKKIQSLIGELIPVIQDAFADISSEWETRKMQISDKFSIEIEAEKGTDFDYSDDKDETDRLAWEAKLKDPNETWPTCSVQLAIVGNNGISEDACTSEYFDMALDDLKYLLECYV